jgi:hypothetical protein
MRNVGPRIIYLHTGGSVLQRPCLALYNCNAARTILATLAAFLKVTVLDAIPQYISNTCMFWVSELSTPSESSGRRQSEEAGCGVLWVSELSTPSESSGRRQSEEAGCGVGLKDDASAGVVTLLKCREADHR